MDQEILERILDGSIKPRDLKLSTLESITENFSVERIIGEGGYGTVYKGVLRNGEIALKRIRNNHAIDEKLFRREVNRLLNVSHKNIVRFLGFCSNIEHKAIISEESREYIYAEDRERILCFEYMNNGSLEKYIADELTGLQWDTRYLIIKGICEGLQYLHMKKHIIHMDLKPANILIDENMVAKITDFGLPRMVENSQTRSTNRFSSPGYTAPEYIDSGEMSVMFDIYSLGVIIIQLVTGHRSIPDSNTVLRKWRHRLHKSGKGTPFRYQQIAKLIEIGLLCQENDPYKRPSLSHILLAMTELENNHFEDTELENTHYEDTELESTDMKISNADESTAGQISPYLEDKLPGIEPLVLSFPFEHNNKLSCSLELTNETNAFIAFNIQTTSPLPYCIQPNKDTIAPRSKYSVNITFQPLDHAPKDMKYTGDFILRRTEENESLTSDDITEDIFHREDGKLVDDMNLMVTHNADVPKESNVPPTEAEPKFYEDDYGEPTSPSKGNITSGSSSEWREYLSSTKPKAMTFQELKDMTCGFSKERLLGRGGYGMVYKGILDNGEEIAIKKLYNQPGLDDDQFKNELLNLMRVQHQNVIRLVGYCSETQDKVVEYEGRLVVASVEERALCLEYMQGGTLEKLLSDESCGLDWEARYRIIKGICQGLKHLHTGSKEPIYHLDLKPANVLLDKEMIPKIADFGLSRLLGSTQTCVTKTVSGTRGYMPPEYIDWLQISSKFDVYSLGVIIIQVIAGREGYYKCADMHSNEFTEHVTENWCRRVQPKAMPSDELLQIQRCIKLALRCVAVKRVNRPTITEIVDELNMIS